MTISYGAAKLAVIGGERYHFKGQRRFNDNKETSSYFVIQPLMIDYGDLNLC